MSTNINGAVWRKMIINAAKMLDQNKSRVDALNVFPVPDGDTGTNMSLTMQSAAKEVAKCPNNNIVDISDALSKGALRGARGNSGVILSQIFRGMANVFTTVKGDINAKTFARALEEGAKVAYKAVTKPKEGTILTVVRAMGEHAIAEAKIENDCEAFLQSVIDAGETMLQRTPEMLPVLKQAGVVDAGGRGLLVIFSGFYNILSGKDDILETVDTVDASSSENGFTIPTDMEISGLENIEFAYCTEFFIINLLKKTTEADIDRFREKLMTLGDCVLVIGDLSMVKVHVHTNTPGLALQAALELGELDKLKIENMLEQSRAMAKSRKVELKPIGMVSVCAGEGMASIFKDLLVDNIIAGGQTMNPSADDIAQACDAVAAEDVFVFPNNKNIILAAEQAKEISKRRLHIIPTVNVPQGISAALSFDPEATVDQNEENMLETMSMVKAGQVTYAVRSTVIDKFELKEGDIIGMDSKNIVAKGESVDTVTKELVDRMMDKEVSTITLYFGSDVKEEQAKVITEELSQTYPRCDVDYHFGGQPLYYYIVSLE